MYSKIQSISAQQKQTTDIGLKKTIDVTNYSLAINANSNSLQKFGANWPMAIIAKRPQKVFGLNGQMVSLGLWWNL